MKIKFLLVVFSSFFMLQCGSSLKVYTTHDKDVDFSKYKTFNFYEIKEEHLKMKEVNRRRLAMAIELELGRKGIKKASNNPDLLVNLYSEINRTQTTTTSGMPGGVGYYGAASPYGTSIGISISPPRNYVENYTKGTVTIDLVDREQNKLILEGVTKVDAGDNADADDMINHAVQKVFSEIPAAGKK